MACDRTIAHILAPPEARRGSAGSAASVVTSASASPASNASGSITSFSPVTVTSASSRNGRQLRGGVDAGSSRAKQALQSVGRSSRLSRGAATAYGRDDSRECQKLCSYNIRYVICLRLLAAARRARPARSRETDILARVSRLVWKRFQNLGVTRPSRPCEKRSYRGPSGIQDFLTSTLFARGDARVTRRVRNRLRDVFRVVAKGACSTPAPPKTAPAFAHVQTHIHFFQLRIWNPLSTQRP